MTEIYNFTEQGLADGNLILALLAIIFVFILIVAFIALIKTYFTNRTLFKKTWGYFKIAAIIIVVIGISVVFIPKEIKTVLLYYDYQKIMDENAYIVENGEIQNLVTYEVLNHKIQDKHVGYDEAYDYPYGSEISFYLNDKFFDTIDSYGQNCFSKEDLKMLQANEFVEIKYIVVDDINIVLSLSVGQPNS